MHGYCTYNAPSKFLCRLCFVGLPICVREGILSSQESSQSVTPQVGQKRGLPNSAELPIVHRSRPALGTSPSDSVDEDIDTYSFNSEAFLPRWPPVNAPPAVNINMPPPVGPLRQPPEVDRFLPSVVFEVKLNEGGILVPPKRNDQYNPDEVANISRLGDDLVCQQLWVCNVFAYFINFMFRVLLLHYAM